jgi:hypothetical protein
MHLNFSNLEDLRPEKWILAIPARDLNPSVRQDDPWSAVEPAPERKASQAKKYNGHEERDRRHLTHHVMHIFFTSKIDHPTHVSA